MGIAIVKTKEPGVVIVTENTKREFSVREEELLFLDISSTVQSYAAEITPLPAPVKQKMDQFFDMLRGVDPSSGEVDK